MKKKILVVEDETLVREGIVELLSSEGFDMYSAPDGDEGLKLAQKHIPDLIICDIMMPTLDGYELLELLQQEEETATIPFIFLTAKSEKTDMRRGMDLGADDFLTKPFKANELFKAVQTRIQKKDKYETKTEERLDELRLSIATILPHELRTPLNGIMASSQLLMEYSDTMEREEVYQLHENIFTSAKRLNRLIVNYLYYTELEMLNKDKARIKKFKKLSKIESPNSILSDLFTIYAENYERLEDLDISLGEEKPIVIFEDHFHKICEEIADNAFKFSLEKDKIKVRTELNDDEYLLKITDYGRGMDVNKIDKIGAYFQFDRNLHEQQGSGLGLVIAKRLLDIYKGNLKIDSRIDKYTTVAVSFPIAETKQD